ncbi:PREDICTED: protein FANTASTIC FOUR 1-like [Nelumbo nucifera]|uniref:Protein FANTASTIC FOUR 1-like n=1 Tax=Nelumbo nucifera TaxID=4432 RepID=A0A1U7ZJE6_NELNU|nr:PREDICTED: protein FANTASTIC FOUR 1-like [Nelumbo nucifera]
MAACGSLEHIFEKPMPENPTLIGSFSPWNQIKSMKPIDLSSFTEIFGELHFKENPKSPSLPSLPPNSSSLVDPNPQPALETLNFKNDGNAINGERTKNNNDLPSRDSLLDAEKKKQYVGCSPKSGDGFSSKNSESLQHCTEGLGFESSDDVEDSKSDTSGDWKTKEEEKLNISKYSSWENKSGEFKRSKATGRPFPPPISCIGSSGKPWVCFKSYRYDGRFILKEIRIPTQEFLHARREDGRLKIRFVQSEGILEEDDEERRGGEEEETEDEATENVEDDASEVEDQEEEEEEKIGQEKTFKAVRLLLGDSPSEG